MQENLIVSVSREYGSGGREIAENLANRLGIAYYDKLFIAKIAQQSGFSDDVIKSYDEKPPDRFMFNPNRFLSGIDARMPVASEVHKAEVAIIKQAAEEGPCVVVGRSADAVLTDKPGLVRVFVSAPLPNRIKRVMRRNDLGEDEARDRIARVDRERAGYHEYFSDREWGMSSSYDLCIDSSRLSIEGTVSVLAQYLQTFVSENPDIKMPQA